MTENYHRKPDSQDTKGQLSPALRVRARYERSGVVKVQEIYYLHDKHLRFLETFWFAILGDHSKIARIGQVIQLNPETPELKLNQWSKKRSYYL